MSKSAFPIITNVVLRADMLYSARAQTSADSPTHLLIQCSAMKPWPRQLCALCRQELEAKLTSGKDIFHEDWCGYLGSLMHMDCSTVLSLVQLYRIQCCTSVSYRSYHVQGKGIGTASTCSGKDALDLVARAVAIWADL